MRTPGIGVDNLIEMLKTADAKQLTLLKRTRPLWWIAAVLWVLVSVGILLTNREQIDSGFPLRGLLALVFCGLAVTLFLQIRKLSAIDYTAPATVFLQKAAKRYQFITTPFLVLSILVSVVLAWAAAIYIVDVFKRYLDIHDASVGIITSFALVALVYVFGYYASKKTWDKTRRPMLEEIRRMQRDL